MLTIETHCHTNASGDCLVRPGDLIATCRKRGIDKVIVTDHNTIAGALVAKEMDPDRVIVGEEIYTKKGELLAAFVQEEITPWLEPEEAIRRLREQGAFISVSHPFDVTRSGHWKLPDLLAIAPFVDAIEIFNARCLLPAYNRRAKEFAAEHGLNGTSGSDAHTLMELGRAAMIVDDFNDAEGLRKVVAQAQYKAARSGFSVRLASRFAALRAKLANK
ncbi:MAG: PHP domain-containing protein [Anaerolineales bacterium]